MSPTLLADGSVVEEESRWDAGSGVDECARRLVRPDGSVLAGTARLRYYSAPEWRTLAAEAGQLELNVMEPVIAYNLFTSLAKSRNWG